MSRLRRTFDSSLGKKYLVAATGLLLIGFLVVTFMVIWTARTANKRFGQVNDIRRWVVMLHATFGTQVILGFLAYWAVDKARLSTQPVLLYSVIEVAHVVMGALVLASSVLLALSSSRLIRPADAVAAESGAARSQAQGSGIVLAANPRAVAERSDFVIIVVGFDSEAEAVLLGRDGIVGAGRRGLIVGIASTVAPSTMARLAARLADSGIVLLDMPLTRGEPAAEAGELLVMVGGDTQAFESCKPALASFASSIFYLGQLGAGQVGKMVNNLILWSCISANHEGLKLAERLGVDPERLRAALLKSSAANWALETRPETMPMPWAEKDMRIVLSEADHLRLALPLCGVVTEVVKSVKIERGWPTPAQRET